MRRFLTNIASLDLAFTHVGDLKTLAEVCSSQLKRGFWHTMELWLIANKQCPPECVLTNPRVMTD